MINPIEIIHNHTLGGKIIISSIPSPTPKMQPAITFRNFLKNIFFPPYLYFMENQKLCEQNH